MKKFIAAFSAAVIALCSGIAIFAGCSAQKNDGKISVVCTIFPEYDWVKNVVGDNENVELTLLLDSGVDLHSYQPTADDIVTVSTCDMFVYVGGESDEWVDDILKQKTNDDMKVINLLEVLGDKVKEEETVEGMEPEEEDGEDGEEIEYDEHVWLSLKNAQVIVSRMAAELGKIDGENANMYLSNAKAYNARLSALDSQYAEAISAAKFDTLVFGDRFPFRYLADDYSLKYYAAFSGCSAESEASFETVIFLAGKVDELGLNCIMKIEGENKIAEAVKNNTTSKNQTILTLNSLQSVTAKDVKDGVTYLKVMAENLEVLKTALN